MNSIFYYEAHSKIWLPPDANANASEMAKQLINKPKVMITIFWNPFGIRVLAALSEKTSFDAEYFIDYVLILIEQLPVTHGDAIRKQTLVIHMDNLPIHKSKAATRKIASMRVTITPHPVYSQDLAPLDFFLFGYIKQKIAGQEFLSADDLLGAIRKAFDRLSRSVLESVFGEWLICLQTCIDYESSYFLEG
jgi:hypothetical protein